jgi:ParB family transcriptional regulator, chromosome partitioning protein
MDLEWHQLDLRYERLRRRSPNRERLLLGSLAQVGQQLPIVVVTDESTQQYVVIDGYKRIRSLKKLKHDTVRATTWSIGECEALMLERLMRPKEGDGPLEQGWLLKELQDRFTLTMEELSKRFDKSKSWVSRRLSLVVQLPETLQARVRNGEVCPHAAMKYLVPLARANVTAAEILAQVAAAQRLSSRQVGELYAGWTSGSTKTKQLIESDPMLYLRAKQEAQGGSQTAAGLASQNLVRDLDALGGIAKRIRTHLKQGRWQSLLEAERVDVTRAVSRARNEVDSTWDRFELEDVHVATRRTGSNTGTSQERLRDTSDSQDVESIPRCGS